MLTWAKCPRRLTPHTHALLQCLYTKLLQCLKRSQKVVKQPSTRLGGPKCRIPQNTQNTPNIQRIWCHAVARAPSNPTDLTDLTTELVENLMGNTLQSYAGSL